MGVCGMNNFCVSNMYQEITTKAKSPKYADYISVICDILAMLCQWRAENPSSCMRSMIKHVAQYTAQCLTL